MKETSNNNMSFSWWSIIGIIAFTLICAAIRVIGAGWILIIYFWMVIPYYLIHFIGQVVTLFRKNITPTERKLVYFSGGILFILTLIQLDCDDRSWYFLLNQVGLLFFHKDILPEPGSAITGFLLSCSVLLALADTIINIYLLVANNGKKRTKASGIFQTGEPGGHEKP